MNPSDQSTFLDFPEQEEGRSRATDKRYLPLAEN